MNLLINNLVQKSKGILTIFPEISDTTGNYQMFDDGGIEVQTSEFLWGLVKLLQPENIQETGTYTGISSLFMAQALKENGHGHLITLEVSEHHKLRAEKLWQACEVNEYVTCQLTPSLEYNNEQKIDLLFLDSEPEFRFQELIKFFPNVRQGGYILIHDLFGHLGQDGPVNPDHPEIPNWPFGTLPEEIVTWLKEDKLRIIPLPAPRGLVLLYKTTKGDFKV